MPSGTSNMLSLTLILFAAVDTTPIALSLFTYLTVFHIMSEVTKSGDAENQARKKFLARAESDPTRTFEHYVSPTMAHLEV